MVSVPARRIYLVAVKKVSAKLKSCVIAVASPIMLTRILSPDVLNSRQASYVQRSSFRCSEIQLLRQSTARAKQFRVNDRFVAISEFAVQTLSMPTYFGEAKN